ncbi:MAG TPA: hypothetical protein VJ732_02170 [Bryobacteraceae bacterium]|nr:hypothetical protein [Bryobacteraceae bacterium]
MAEALNVIMRWLHIASVVTLIGGMLFARFVMIAAARSLPRESSETLGENAAARFRPFVYAAIGALILSGIYNIVSSPGHTVRYYVALAIKLLLVAHVFAVAILVVQPKNPRRERMLTGTVISGLVIIAISAYLRRIF